MQEQHVHPNLLARGTKRDLDEPVITVIVYAPNEARAQWVEAELARANYFIQVGRTVDQIVSALVEDPPPRPQVLVVDCDATSAADLLHLHSIRENGWCGRIIGLGRVPPPLRASLGIERVINTPFEHHSLAHAIAEIGFHAQTRRIPTFDSLDPLPLPPPPRRPDPASAQVRASVVRARVTITPRLVERVFTTRGRARVSPRK